MPAARTVQKERLPEDAFRLECRTGRWWGNGGAMAGNGAGQPARVIDRGSGAERPMPPAVGRHRLCRPAVRLAMQQKKKAGIPAWEPPPGERAAAVSIAG